MHAGLHAGVVDTHDRCVPVLGHFDVAWCGAIVYHHCESAASIGRWIFHLESHEGFRATLPVETFRSNLKRTYDEIVFLNILESDGDVA